MKEMLKSLSFVSFGDYYGDKIKMQLTQLIVMLFKQIHTLRAKMQLEFY
jgi:hypothetical protein